MKLFDARERTDFGTANYAESVFGYLNRTARYEFNRIRNEIDDWFSHYPEPGQAELRARFRSDVEVQHQAAFFELYIHELLVKLNCEVVLHPRLPGIPKSVDFFVRPQIGERFYLEATVAARESSTESAARARMDVVYDVLDRVIVSPDFFLALKVKGAPNTPPNSRQLASFVQKHITGLDPDEIQRLYDISLDAVPRWHYKHDGWELEFRPVPKKANTRGKPGLRPIGSRSTTFEAVDHRSPVREAINQKAGRYGELGLPYIVAVNAMALIHEDDVLDALFGTEQVSILYSQNDPSAQIQTEISRMPDGAWLGPNGPKNTRVSGTLVISRLSAWTIPRATIRLYHHPWAQWPYQSVLTRFPQAIPQENRIVMVNGESLGTVLGLPASWPEDAA